MALGFDGDARQGVGMFRAGAFEGEFLFHFFAANFAN
jgi:hypothetical protein